MRRTINIMDNIHAVRSSIDAFGVWYAIHEYGFRNLWTIFVATRMK